MRKSIVTLLLAAGAAVAAFSARTEPKDIVWIGAAHDEHDVNKWPVFRRLIASGDWGRFRIIDGMDNLTKADLAAAKIVVVSCVNRYALDAHDLAVQDALVEYARAGGGLILRNMYGQMWAFTEFNDRLMRRFGGEIAMEHPVFPKSAERQIGAFGPDLWASSDRVFGPFRAGVTNVLIRSYYQMNCDHGAVPFRPNADWKVALSAGADVGTEPFSKLGLAFLDERVPEKGCKGDAPIVGYREFGKGRVVWFGISQLLERVEESEAIRELLDRILEKGAEGDGPVETGRFCCNVLNWAGANAAHLNAAAIPNLKSRAEEEAHQNKAFHFYKGVVGPRTTHSSGRSTTAEYIAKAKALGHDFIVFLEEFDKLSHAEYEKLRAECAAATDDSFTAWPGFTYKKDNGNCQYVFSFEPIYPGEYFVNEKREFRAIDRDTPERGYNPRSDSNFSGGTDLDYLYGKLSFVNNPGWYMFHDSPYRMTDNRTVLSMGVVTRQNGRLMEKAFDAYKINCRNGQALIPIALELMTSADYLTKETLLSSFGIEGGVSAFRHAFMVHGTHSGYPREGIYGSQGVSNGPEVSFRPNRGDYAGNADLLYCKDLSYWPYALKVTAEAGLDTIEILDADRVIRRWRANGAKTFARNGAFAVERQHYLWARVTDRKGGKAFTRACNCETFLLRENQCGDRENQLLYSSQPRKDPNEPPFFSSYGADCAIPDKGPWHGRIRPVGFFVFDKKYGLGGYGGHDGSPEDHPALALSPSVQYGGRPSEGLGWVREFVAGKEGGPHCRPERVVASSDALVADTVLDGVFAFDRRPILHVWHSLFPVYDSAFADTRARNTVFIPKLDGAVAYQWEQSLTFKQPVPSAADKPIVTFGNVRFSTQGRETAAYVGGAWIKDIVNKRFAMKPGDFLVVKNPAFGSLAVYPLAPVDYTLGSFTMLGDGSTYPAGKAFDFRLVAMGFHKFTADPFVAAQQAANAYGIGGANPAYCARLMAGRGRANGVCFDAVAEKGALVGRFVGLTKLPGTLGLRLAGLNDNVSAVVASKTGVRLVPVEKGVAYAALRDEESDGDLFVGHPVSASDPRLVLTLTKAGDAPWTLEVHNPTDAPVAAKLTSHPAFRAFKFAKTVTVPAGSSLDLAL